MAGRYFFVLRRLIVAPLTLFMAFTLVFVMMQILPGDPAGAILGPGVEESVRVDFLQRIGYYRPIQVKYLDYLWGYLHGDMGLSYRTLTPISGLVAQTFPVTLTIAVSAMTMALLIGIPMGILSALRRDTKVDVATSVFAFLGISMPGFWLAIIMILVFSVYLGILPASGFVNPLADPVEGIRHLIMPSFMLGVICSAYITRMTRSSVLEVLLQDYITTARSKGLRERVVIYKHALKNAFIPVVTVIGFQFGGLLGGSIIAESVFTITGLGRTMYWAILGRDFPLIQAITMTIVTLFVIVNLVVDVLYMYLDPRVRLA